MDFHEERFNLPVRVGYGSRAVGREFVFQEHHVDVLADFNRICTVRSTACHSSSLEFDLLIRPPPFTLSSLSLSLSIASSLSLRSRRERAFSPIPVRAEYSGGVRSMDGLAAR